MVAEAPAIVVGAGIGGLTSALCLAQRGWPVIVVERTPLIEGLGAGLQISPNASRLLIDLGLGDRLAQSAFTPTAIEMRDGRSSKLLARTEILEARWGAPYWHLHRGDLLATLLDAVVSEPHIEVRTGSEAVSVDQDGERVRLSTDIDDYDGALLIGADGIHSRIREALFGEQPANFTGNVAYRGIVPAGRLPDDAISPTATARLGPGAHFVHYYVRGGELVNCVCVVEQTDWRGESWTEPADVDALREAFAGWAGPVETLIDAMDPETCFKWALFDREPMRSWHRGRIGLLGDACHPTLPFMAQGAAMAIEDAVVLAACLDDDVESGLKRYESRRRDRTAWVQRGSRRNARIYHLSGVAARLRNAVLPLAGRRSMERLYGYNALE